MARDTTNLSLDELTFHELRQEHLMKHAKSLGGKKAVEAVKYLIEINKRIPPTKDDLAAKRKELKAKTKRKKVVTKDEDGKVIATEYKETSSRLYSDSMIEKLMDGYKGELVNSTFKQKRLYCAKYWKDKLPKTDKSKEISYDDELAALLEELEQEQ